jgi:hypothetical protein
MSVLGVFVAIEVVSAFLEVAEVLLLHAMAMQAIIAAAIKILFIIFSVLVNKYGSRNAIGFLNYKNFNSHSCDFYLYKIFMLIKISDHEHQQALRKNTICS